MAEEARVITDKGSMSQSDLAKAVGSDFMDIDTAAITASKDWQGLGIRFKRACTVTIPADLPANISFGWSQETAGAITFVAAQGASIQSLSNLKSSAGQYAMGGVSGWGTAGQVRLYGQLA